MAFAGLCQRAKATGSGELKSRHNATNAAGAPTSDRRVAQRFHNVCAGLVVWSPVFGEVSYLPQLVFPFSVIYGSDEMACLETVMTLLLWFGHSWQATYPSPPIHLTDAYDRLLELHDPRLHQHLYSLSLSPGPLLWQLLSTFFSEILPSDTWLSLMDRVFTNVRDVEFVHLVPLALLRLVRISLLSTAEQRHVVGFLREPQTILLPSLMKMIEEMRKTTPALLLSSLTGQHTRGAHKQLSKNTVSSGGRDDEDLDKARVHVSISRQEGKPLFPLPKGQYPAYDGYPAHLLDWQVQERSRVLAMKREIEVREETLLELEQHIRQARARPHPAPSLFLTLSLSLFRQMETEQNLLSQTQGGHKGSGRDGPLLELMEREKEYLSQLTILEERITKQRLLNMRKVEEMTKEQLSITEQVESEARELLQKSEGHLRERIEAAMLTGKHRELGEVAEMMTRAKMEELYSKRWREEKLIGVTAAIRLQQENLDLKHRFIQEKWRHEDDEVRLESRLKVEEAKLRLQNQVESNLEIALEENALRLYREQETQIMELERQRNLRLLKEHALSSAVGRDGELLQFEEPPQRLSHSRSHESSSSSSSSSSTRESLSSVSTTRTVPLQGLIGELEEKETEGGVLLSGDRSLVNSTSTNQSSRHLSSSSTSNHSRRSGPPPPPHLEVESERERLASSDDSDDLLEEAQRILDKTEGFAAADLRRKALIRSYVSELSMTSRSSDSVSGDGRELLEENQRTLRNSSHQEHLIRDHARVWEVQQSSSWKIDHSTSAMGRVSPPEINPPPTLSHGPPPTLYFPSKTTRALEQLTETTLR
jgi:hypothetical protein